MSNKLPRKALIAISSFNGAIYPEGLKTGVFFVEALHPYEVLTGAGFEVDLASETGTFGFDDISLTPPFLSGSEHAILNNPKHAFMVKIKEQLKKASDLNKKIMASSSLLLDMLLCMTTRKRRACKRLPPTSGSAAVSWVPCVTAPRSCRELSIPRQVNPIIHGKTVTGFTIEGELIFRILNKLRADGVVTVIDAVTAAGAFYSGPMGAFDDYSITSGRVVTGTNPASGRSAAERGVKVFDKLELYGPLPKAA